MSLRPLPGTVLGQLDGRGALFCEAQQRLYQLDPPATTVWSALWTEGRSHDATAALLAGRTGCSLHEAADYVAACLEQWRVAGFIGAPEPTGAVMPFPLKAETEAGFKESEVFDLAGFRVAIAFPDGATAAAFRAVAGHRLVSRPPAIDLHLTIASHPSGYRVADGEGDETVLPDAAAVAVWLKNSILEAVLAARPGLIAVHAAALQGPRGVVLLAGSSGRGKTTVSAVLNARGWALIADDVTLIDAGSPQIQGFPFAFAAKPGSWPVLRAYFPDLDALHCYLRPDGRTVRYVPPNAVAEGDTTINAVVFPVYTPDGPTKRRPLDRISALVKLLEEARNGRRRLTCEGFETMTRILAGAEVIEVAYGQAGEVADLLGSLAGGSPLRLVVGTP